MKRDHVARVGNGNETHEIAGQWRYDRDNHTTCGRAATVVEHMVSGALLPVTCRGCIRLNGMRKGVGNS